MLMALTLQEWVMLAVWAGVIAEFAAFMIWHRRDYPWREAAISLPFLVGLTPFIAFPALNEYFPGVRLQESAHLGHFTVETWWSALLLYLLVDLAHYAAHRAAHRCHWLWASHSVHHTIESLKLVNGFRVALTELPFGGFVFFLPVVMIGFEPMDVARFHAANFLFQHLAHASFTRRLGPLEWVFSTPSHHLLHHAANPEYLDRNFGGTFILWDRLFGTLAIRRPDVQIRLGLVGGDITPLNPAMVAVRPFKTLFRAVGRARTWRERFLAVFGPPEFAARLLADRTRDPGPVNRSIASIA